MSDQTNEAGDGIHENHWCCLPDCKKWDSFGFSTTKAEKKKW